MRRLKRILVSLVISLILIVIGTLIYNSYINSNFVAAYILKEDATKGAKLDKANIMCVQIKLDKKNSQSIMSYATLEEINNMYSSSNIKAGDIIKLSDLSIEPGILEEDGFEYIAIPFENPEDIMGHFNISKGSKVNLYFTSKVSDASNVLTTLKDKTKIYSTDGKDAVVTANLYSSIEVIEALDMDGQKAINTKISQLVFKIPKNDAVLLTNLKVYSTFSITLIE